VSGVGAHFFQQRGFILHGRVHAINQQHSVRFARIVTAFENTKIDQRMRGNPQALHDGRGQRLRRMVERKFEFGESQHIAIIG
jgi:hypothetical protein